MIRSIVDRLMEPGTPFRIVGGAGALASVKDRPPQVPAAYVYEAADRSHPTERATGLILQRNEGDIAVVIVTENLSGTDDFEAAEDIVNLRKYVRRRLVGFIPTDAADPLQHVAGEMQQAVNSTIWFEDVYSTAHYIEEQP
ncbi:phage tail terminator protein [Ensifer sp. B1-9]|uniref:phage tail terminator protein n=1 Tax=Ensifer sp. B1-9 TaxID=3141455 RepID=UPI003D1FBBD7